MQDTNRWNSLEKARKAQKWHSSVKIISVETLFQKTLTLNEIEVFMFNKAYLFVSLVSFLSLTTQAVPLETNESETAPAVMTSIKSVYDGGSIRFVNMYVAKDGSHHSTKELQTLYYKKTDSNQSSLMGIEFLIENYPESQNYMMPFKHPFKKIDERATSLLRKRLQMQSELTEKSLDQYEILSFTLTNFLGSDHSIDTDVFLLIQKTNRDCKLQFRNSGRTSQEDQSLGEVYFIGKTESCQ